MPIQIVIVTPEKTTLDQTCESVVVPMYDGEAGVLPGHAPLIGRLGPGELRIRESGKVHRYYVDGGFVQISNNVVSVLTGTSMSAGEIDAAAAREDLARAEKLDASTAQLTEVKRKALARARAKIRMTQKSVS